MPCPHGKPSVQTCSICGKQEKTSAPTPKSPGLPKPAIPSVSASKAPVELKLPESGGISVTDISGKGVITRTADEWFERFRTLSKSLTAYDLKIVRDTLVTLGKKGAAFNSEADLQRVMMATVVEVRRPKLGGKAVVIGIPYRDDGGSKAILEDVRRVRDGTLCDVVVLVPPAGFGRWKPAEVVEWLTRNRECAMVWKAGTSLRTLCLDAIYISGGPHDHPAMKGKPKNPPKEDRAKEAQDRHDFESAVIRCALRQNLPILGICGGSWRLAAELGAAVERLPPAVEKEHAKPMSQPLLHAHEVEIRPMSMLNQILQTDNYLRFPDQRPADTAPAIHANSVHWAQSVIPITSPLQIVGRTPVEGGTPVTEAFEARAKEQHFAMGVQWHPEYAMDQLEGADVGDARRHRQVLRALGDAGRDGKAATIIQKQFRGFLARKKMKHAKTSAPKDPPKPT